MGFLKALREAIIREQNPYPPPPSSTTPSSSASKAPKPDRGKKPR